MKHLKNYKLFESSSEEIFDYLKEIFSELDFYGYNIDIVDPYSMGISKFIKVRISKNKSFKLSDIFDLILTSDSYMNDNDWGLERIRFRTPESYFFLLNKSDIENLKNLENLKKEIDPINYRKIARMNTLQFVYVELTFKSNQ